MATGGGAGRFPTIPDSGAGRGRRLERHSEMGNPFGGSGVLTCEAIHGSVGQRRGMATVEVDHRPREPVRSTERLRSLRRRRRG
jgi:hypothetical protein